MPKEQGWFDQLQFHEFGLAKIVTKKVHPRVEEGFIRRAQGLGDLEYVFSQGQLIRSQRIWLIAGAMIVLYPPIPLPWDFLDPVGISAVDPDPGKFATGLDFFKVGLQHHRTELKRFSEKCLCGRYFLHAEPKRSDCIGPHDGFEKAPPPSVNVEQGCEVGTFAGFDPNGGG